MRRLLKMIISWPLAWGSWGSWTIFHRRFAWLRNWHHWDRRWEHAIRILDWRWVEINRSIWSLLLSWYWSAGLAWPFGRSDTRSVKVHRVDAPPSVHRNFCGRWTCNWGWSRLAWASIVGHLNRPRERCLISGLISRYFDLLFVGVALLGCLEWVGLFHLLFCLFGHVSYNYYRQKKEVRQKGMVGFLGLEIGVGVGSWRNRFITADLDERKFV